MLGCLIVLCRFFLLLMLALPMAHAQNRWLTVLGDPASGASDIIQVDPIPMSATGDHRTMRVRVNRANQRTSWDGTPYRSYESVVLFNCASNTARYVEIRFFMQPAWAGQPHQAATYTAAVPRWMLFRDVEPNPYQRIIHAACGTVSRR